MSLTTSNTPQGAAATKDNSSIIGRGNKEGNQLFRDWYQELTTAPSRGEHSAYVFVMGSLAEILQSFGIHTIFPEVNGLQTAVRHVADDYIAQGEDYGYSTDVCAYVKADVGLQLRGGDHPMGKIPKPSLAVYTNACNTYLKWAEIWERMYNMPSVTIDVPGSRADGRHTWSGHVDFENDLKYVRGQLDELITVCETVTGKKFDIDKLRETMHYTNVMMERYERLIELNKARPAPYSAVTDGTVYLGVANSLRGRAEGAKYFTDLVEEMEYKVANGLGTTFEEKYRLIFVGVPCYPIFRRFNEMFTEWGGAFVGSSYMWFASGGANTGFQFDLARPLDSLAEGLLVTTRDAMDTMFFSNRNIVDAIEPFGIDGVVYHPIKSCRTVSTGLADNRRAVIEETGAATLFVESDHMDKRVVSEAQLKNRVDAFFEGLATRRVRQGAGESK
ncbi:MAG: 2-hydroxyacyl-CoA dehydratase family protein [Actinobacteria bacterium]|jgi:benzoyl-CoA reductase subunit B|nr:2-hydroxyacyl-CoA dehydratase family protein [Actinomycetota bacterium]